MLEVQNFLVVERAAIFKTIDVYDVFDADTGEQVGVAEERIPGWMKTLRWIVTKKLMPTSFEIREHPSEATVAILKKPFALFRPIVEVYDAENRRLGYFKAKLISLGGGFYVYDDRDQQVAEVKGKWHGWDFKFVTPSGQELGHVTKKWAGLAKELFTSADKYVVSIADDLRDQPIAKILLLSAAIAIDSVFYEQSG
ncbi:MAG: phospholipid scramblase family protein [Gemmataceae bacterium]|nr:phospholipid scramblase family protein [Gemmataceae bacterium]